MKKIALIGALILVVLAAYWIYYGRNPLKKLMPGSPAPTPEPAPGNPQPETKVNGSFVKTPEKPADVYGFPLRQGSTGEYVRKMQAALNSRYGSDLVVDGIFGPKTAKALSAHGFNPEAIYWKHYYEILGVKI